MRCPHCKDEVLISLEYEKVEVDYCTACKGVWLDSGELELLIGNEEATVKFLTIGSPAQAPKGEKHRKCPECLARMTKESTTTDPAIIFDHCPQGDGLWFDAGELATILNHAEETLGQSEVSTFLKDVFGQSKQES